MVLLSWLLWFLGSLCACPANFLLSIQGAHARRLCAPSRSVSLHAAVHMEKAESGLRRQMDPGLNPTPTTLGLGSLQQLSHMEARATVRT